MQSFVHYMMLIFKVTLHLLDGYHFNLLIYEVLSHWVNSENLSKYRKTLYLSNVRHLCQTITHLLYKYLPLTYTVNTESKTRVLQQNHSQLYI